MKQISMVLSLAAILAFSANPLAAEIKVYDDFSTGTIDGKRWRQREYVREIVDGEVVFKLGNRSPGMSAEITQGVFRSYLPIRHPEIVNAIACDITIVETRLDSPVNARSFIGIAGYFYNKNQAGGGAAGDIFAQIMIGDQGNGKIEAFWEVHEILTDDTLHRDVIGAGTIDAFDTSIVNPPYRVKLSYDGDKTFVFSVNDAYTALYNRGPDRRSDAVTSWKDISAGIDAMEGANRGYIHGKIDNVHINAETAAYDAFDDPFIDPGKWSYNEWVREASRGYLRANSLEYGSTDSTPTHLSYAAAPYLEAKVRIDSTSQLSAGAVGVGRIQGYYYNDRRGPGSGQGYNAYEGDVFAQIRLRYGSDGSLLAQAFVDRSEDADQSAFANLFSHDFSVPMTLDAYTAMSIRFTGNHLIFGCAGETAEYDISTPAYPPFGTHRHLRSIVYLDPGEAGYINVSFDDVRVDTYLSDLQPLDGDVDGLDLFAYIMNDEGIHLADFAHEYGRIMSP